MSGFVANAPNAAPAPDEAPIAHGDFFPGIKLSSVRNSLRTPTAVTPDRLTDAIFAAMLSVGLELADWAEAQRAAGFATLAAVAPTDTIGGEPRLVRLYHRAILSFAGAELADTHSDISATADGQKRLEERALTADEHRRNATHAIRDIIGATRTSVELI